MAGYSLLATRYSQPALKYTLFVKAMGKSSIQNQMSAAVTYRRGNQPPTVKLTVDTVIWCRSSDRDRRDCRINRNRARQSRRDQFNQHDCDGPLVEYEVGI